MFYLSLTFPVSDKREEARELMIPGAPSWKGICEARRAGGGGAGDRKTGRRGRAGEEEWAALPRAGFSCCFASCVVGASRRKPRV